MPRPFYARTVLGGLALALLASAAPAEAQTVRTYYLAADTVRWNYAPGELNRMTGEPFDPMARIWVENGPDRIGKIYKKAIFRAYTDSTFTRRQNRSSEWQHLGFLGPLMRAEVGDTLRVVLRNQADIPVSLHPHGVFYTKAHEGVPYADGSGADARGDDAVAPGETYTYVWPVPERAGPAEDDPSSIVWTYHSHVDEPRDVNAGLMGPIVVTTRGLARPDGSPTDVDREFVVSFHEIDENLSHYLEENIQAYTGDPESVDRSHIFFWQPFGGSNFMETVNGFTFGYLPGLEMDVGERVRWYVLSSTNFEIHTPHWHGNTGVRDGKRTDVFGIGAMDRAVMDMVPDSPGTWMLHCHIKEHNFAGMQALYTVRP